MNIVLRLLAVVGRGFLELIHGIWIHLCLPILGGIGHGVGRLIGAVMPYILGFGGLYALMVFAPETFQSLLAIAIMCGVLYGFFRMVFPGKKKKGD
jgi:hypothetical protein